MLEYGFTVYVWPDILVAPIFEHGQRSREVYLPEKQAWKNAKTGEVFQGGQAVTVDVSLEEIPLFVGPKKIIPYIDLYYVEHCFTFLAAEV